MLWVLKRDFKSSHERKFFIQDTFTQANHYTKCLINDSVYLSSVTNDVTLDNLIGNTKNQLLYPLL